MGWTPRALYVQTMGGALRLAHTPMSKHIIISLLPTGWTHGALRVQPLCGVPRLARAQMPKRITSSLSRPWVGHLVRPMSNPLAWLNIRAMQIIKFWCAQAHAVSCHGSSKTKPCSRLCGRRFGTVLAQEKRNRKRYIERERERERERETKNGNT